MGTLFVLICSLALVCAARGEKEQKQAATGTKTSQHAATHNQHPSSNSGHVQQAAMHNQPPTSNSGHVQRVQSPQNVVVPRRNAASAPAGTYAAPVGQPGHPQPQGGRPQTAAAVQPAVPPLTKEQQAQVDAQSQGFRSAEQYREWKETGRVERPAGVALSGAPAGEHGMTAPGSGRGGSRPGLHPFPSRHFDLLKAPRPGIENVRFQSGRHIPECEKWRDSRYNAFRNYTATWHDAVWWRTHYPRIVFVLGGWYYWHANYWYPAWGYQSEAVYGYDGPVYAFNNLEPDQVVANVQAALQELGYYQGPLDGVMGAATREAIANYQRDHGLYITSAIDEPTLAALGMA